MAELLDRAAGLQRQLHQASQVLAVLSRPNSPANSTRPKPELPAVERTSSAASDEASAASGSVRTRVAIKVCGSLGDFQIVLGFALPRAPPSHLTAERPSSIVLSSASGSLASQVQG